ncbi:MAG: phenylalanine 4-monooxygenase [Gammaproteobacteria bacterium]|nr:phenylalanine 4-monooxygenase [Gammaproteobacteria bacterium]
MSYKETQYVAKSVDAAGNATYTPEENAVWQTLITRQMKIIQNRACPEYIEGLRRLDLPEDRVPQCAEVTAALTKASGWALEPVPALIPFDRFFHLLANKRFPAATFIRTMEELDYLKEPDIFHEVYGHCPLLTFPEYAKFIQYCGELGLNATPKERVLIARLFWYTIEFGLIKTSEGLRAYGGGILSSISETEYAIESNVPKRIPFDLMTALKTPYRIDEIQPLYFVLDNFEQLYHLMEIDLMYYIRQSQLDDQNQSGPDSAC